MYNGTAIDNDPTPRPATILPIVMWTQLFIAVIWIMFPMMNQHTANVRVFFRPHQSRMYDPSSAPTRVPMLMSETNKLLTMDSNSFSPLALVCPNRSIKSRKSRICEI